MDGGLRGIVLDGAENVGENAILALNSADPSNDGSADFATFHPSQVVGNCLIESSITGYTKIVAIMAVALFTGFCFANPRCRGNNRQ